MLLMISSGTYKLLHHISSNNGRDLYIHLNLRWEPGQALFEAGYISDSLLFIRYKLQYIH